MTLRLCDPSFLLSILLLTLRDIFLSCIKSAEHLKVLPLMDVDIAMSSGICLKNSAISSESFCVMSDSKSNGYFCFKNASQVAKCFIFFLAYMFQE